MLRYVFNMGQTSKIQIQGHYGMSVANGIMLINTSTVIKVRDLIVFQKDRTLNIFQMN